MNKKKYLNRINYKEKVKPILKTLQSLQQHHLLNIPFENLDIHKQQPIILNLDKIYEKIITKKRGGFCYELNGLFCELLESLGFSVKRVSARVYDEQKGYGPDYDHLAILVEIQGAEYLTDVGFGEFCFAPLRLELNAIQEDKRGLYMMNRYNEQYICVNKIEKGKPIPEYIFSLTAQELEAFEGMCHYHQTSVASHFTQKKLITRPTLNGRITLTSNALILKKNKEIEKKTIDSQSVFEEELWNYFNMKMI